MTMMGLFVVGARATLWALHACHIACPDVLLKVVGLNLPAVCALITRSCVCGDIWYVARKYQVRRLANELACTLSHAGKHLPCSQALLWKAVASRARIYLLTTTTRGNRI